MHANNYYTSFSPKIFPNNIPMVTEREKRDPTGPATLSVESSALYIGPTPKKLLKFVIKRNLVLSTKKRLCVHCAFNIYFRSRKA